jgi:regulator of ribonuclease activity A
MSETTADLCDKHKGRFKVISMGLQSFGGQKCCHGPIQTLSMRGDVMPLRAVLSKPGDGRILVVDVGGRGDYAVFGDQLAALAAENNWSSVVINGFIRDVSIVSSTPVGVWARGTKPNRSWEIHESVMNRKIIWGNIRIAPGDYLYCDDDGLIVSELPLS